jgi:type IV pilus assembly protein PilW
MTTMSRISASRGFGLIEIMVGLAIGMIATIIMFQALAVSERQKRTTTGAADAQTNGAIALFALERDIKMAGWGLQGSVFAGCTSFFTYDTAKSGAIDSNTTPGSSLAAVLSIVDGGNDPDAVTIQYYDNPSSQDFHFSIATLTAPQATADAAFVVSSVKGCSPGDLLIVGNGLDCTLAQVSAVATTTKTLSHDPGGAYPYNAPVASMTGWPVHTVRSRLQCIPSLYQRKYEIVSGHLQLTQPDGTSEVAAQILDLQAEYGVDKDDGTPGIDWKRATGADWLNPDIAHIRRIKAARIAVLARSVTYEKPGNSGCSATTDAMAAAWSTWATFNTGRLPADWKCYRYKSYEIHVPLRNVIWSRT